jgi:ABC-type glycerol-3-phosphate transport system substrate-binding protein
VPAKKEDFTIRFMERGGAEACAVAQKLIDEKFVPENPGIKVQVEPAPDGWVEKLLAQMIAGDAVDLFQAWGNIFFNWVERDLLLDCQPYVESTMTDAEVADFNDFQWDGLMMRGKRVGMPKYINIMTIRLNKDMFEEYNVPLPPGDGEWDHDDYKEMVCALTDNARAKGNDGVWGGWLPGWSWDRFWNHVHMFGGKIVDEKYGKKCLMGEPEAQAGLQWMYDLEWTTNCHAQPSQVENQWPNASMVSGFICTAEDGTYPITVDKEYDGKVTNWDIRHVPKGPTGIRSVLGTTDAWSITKQTKNADASWALLKWMAGPWYQEAYIVGDRGIIPVLKSLQTTFITKVRELRPNLNNVRLETISEAFEWGYPEDTPWFDKQTAATELIIPALEKVFTVGDVGPEYFIEIAKQVDATQV